MAGIPSLSAGVIRSLLDSMGLITVAWKRKIQKVLGFNKTARPRLFPSSINISFRRAAVLSPLCSTAPLFLQASPPFLQAWPFSRQQSSCHSLYFGIILLPFWWNAKLTSWQQLPLGQAPMPHLPELQVPLHIALWRERHETSLSFEDTDEWLGEGFPRAPPPGR